MVLFQCQNHVKNSILKGKFERAAFPIDYIIKDLDLALVTSTKYHVPIYLGSLARQAYELARAAGYSERYYPVVIKPLEELTGVEVRADLEDE